MTDEINSMLSRIGINNVFSICLWPTKRFDSLMFVKQEAVFSKLNT